MLELSNGMILYHGSYTPITKIDLNKCLAGKDFGKGFYLTASLKQAQNFVHLSVRRAVLNRLVPFDRNYGYVTLFRYIDGPFVRPLYFESANIDWLHYVAGNRDSSIFPDIVQQYSKYNVIGGKIANDQTTATLQAYVDAVNGIPGDPRVDKLTIEALLPNRLENQFCFKTEEALDALVYMESERYEFNGK